ncbi:MAG: hypothetical protein ACO35C_03920 [Pontimonas sp.]
MCNNTNVSAEDLAERLLAMLARIPRRTGVRVCAGGGVPLVGVPALPCGTPVCSTTYKYVAQTGLWELVLCCLGVVLVARQERSLARVAVRLRRLCAIKERGRYFTSSRVLLADPRKTEKLAQALRSEVGSLRMAGGATDDDRRCLEDLAALVGAVSHA